MKHTDRKQRRKAEQARRNERTNRAKAKQGLVKAWEEGWA